MASSRLDLCVCYVAHLDDVTRFTLHWGAHDPSCPTYRESGDIVDAAHDAEFRRNFVASTIAAHLKRTRSAEIPPQEPVSSAFDHMTHGFVAGLTKGPRAFALPQVVAPAPRLGVAGILKDRQGRCLFGRSTKIPHWVFPGGGVEPGEALADALRRELLEETGMKVGIGDVMAVGQILGPDPRVIVYFDTIVPGDAKPTPGGDIAELRYAHPQEVSVREGGLSPLTGGVLDAVSQRWSERHPTRLITIIAPEVVADVSKSVKPTVAPPVIKDEDHEPKECGPYRCACICRSCMQHGMSGWA